ncbi:hypothetical protein CVIRNUC_006580 [Coccomyxa viridis]|uniref:Eukaryotic translation initiation factor 4 gamma 2 n=1 Tax=Coccomyxa viridis TaxID=1274662 RepID=A0AAV1I9J7_9CHLO|nr:hypothetical protein CVIRNUC_006580 [Coccomyxa viridis]
MSEPGNTPTNTNAGQNRGGRNSYPRGRGQGPVQRGNEGTTAGRSGGRAGGRGGPLFDRPRSGQQIPQRVTDGAHQPQFYVNPGRVPGQQLPAVGASVASGPPGMGGLQFGTVDPNLIGANQYAPGQTIPVAQVQQFMSQGRGHPAQQPKLQHQPQHVAKASGGAQVPIGMGSLPGAAIQQAQPYPQRQMMMQGHQTQPGQQTFPAPYQNAGYYPPGLPMGRSHYSAQLPHPTQHQHPLQHQHHQQHQHPHQHQHQAPSQPPQSHPASAPTQPQGQASNQAYRNPQPQSAFSGPQSVLPKAPAREKKKLSLVDPNTGKAIDLGGGSSKASVNGTVSPVTPGETTPVPARSLSEASKSRPPAKTSPSKVQTLRKPSPIKAAPVDVAPVVRVSPAEPKADQLTPAREEQTLPDLLKAATIEESKPTKAANGAPAEKEGSPQQPESDAQAELEVSSMPTNPSALLPSLAPEAKAKGSYEQSGSKESMSKPAPAPTPVAKDPSATSPDRRPPVMAKEAGKGEQAMMAQATAPEAAPLASEREQKPAEPSMPDVPDTAVPARSAAAESGIAKDDQPKEAGSSLAPQPAQAVPTTEETPKAVPDIQADQKDGSAEPASASAAATVDVTPSGSVDNGPAEVATAQEAQAAAEDTAALPVDNGDVGNHVVEGKGIGLEAAAGAAAEQEEAIKDAKSSAPDEDRPEEAAVVAAPAVPAPSAKAKRKAALSKANAEGPKGTLLDAFTGPPPTAAEPQAEPVKAMPKQMPPPAASPPASAPEKAHSNEADDWETVAEGMTTPSAAKAAAFKATSESASSAVPSGKKVYSRDWLLTLQDGHRQEPHGLVGSGLLMREGGGGGPPSGRAGPSGGFEMRGGPRGAPHMGGPHGGPPGVGSGGPPATDTSRWDRGSMMPPPSGPPGMAGRGIMGPPPPGGGRGGGRGASGIDGAKWQRGLQPPPPPPGMAFTGPQHGYGRSAPSLHKTDNAYKLGATSSDDPDEEKRQKEFKSLLNKLTLDNYETIKDKIVSVGIVSVTTLKGLIDQVFDKALGEPGFSGVYARICYDLNQVLPSFKVLDEEGREEEVEFRRVLLNKCQSEFEEGGAAMRAVEAREKRQREEDAAKAQGKAKEEEREDGEITDSEKQVKAEEKRQKAREDMEAAQRELKARRRALGNIQFIGNLYQNRMLTEKIMHGCITELLTEVNSPKAEEVECLCKLMSTIGHLLDASKKGTERMDAYFMRMQKVKEAKSLESRHRFLIQDVIDLRERQGWQARRKVEGPKKIEDIHKEARMEQQRARMAPPPDRRDRRDRMPDRPAMPLRPPERSRVDDRVDGPIRAMNRAPSYEYLATGNALRPGGGAAAREPSMPSLRPGGPGALGAGAGARGSGIRTPSPAREPAAPSAAPSVAPAPPAPAVEEPKELTAEQLALRATTLVEEYLTNRDAKELLLSLQELHSAHADMACLVEGFFNGSFALKGVDREQLVDMLVEIAKKQDQAHLTAEHLEAGIKLVLDTLDQTYIDVPFAPWLVGRAIGALVAQGALELKPMAEHILKAESEEDPERGQDEDAGLIDSGEGLKVIAAVLKRLQADKGAAPAKEAWTATGLTLLEYVPKFEREEEDTLQKVLNKYELQSFHPVEGIQSFLPSALAEARSAEDISDWIREHSGDAADAPEFAEFLAVQLFTHMLGTSPDAGKSVFTADSEYVPLLLTFVSDHGNREVAMVWGAQRVFEDRQRPKGLLRRMLTDLHSLRIVSGQALETWRYKTGDTEAIKDVSSWLDELRNSDEGPE